MRRFAAIVLACAATAVACGSPPSYPEEIAAHRAEIDAFMRGDSQSPIPPGQRAAFQPLPYYPIDEQYRVPAALRVARGDEIIEMSTSTGKPRRMRRIGTLAFTLKGEPLTLTAFAEADDTALRRARIFVDSFPTTLGHIGELEDPLARGVIGRADVLGDLHDLVAGRVGRRGPEEITLFKNGGGAHLDLMAGRAILAAWRAAGG